LYFIAYFTVTFFTGITGNNINNEFKIGRMLDILILLFLLVTTFISYFTTTDKEKIEWLNESGSNITNYIENPASILTTIMFLFFFYTSIFLFSVPMSSNTKPFFVSSIESIAWLVLLLCIFVVFFDFTFGVNLVDYMVTSFNLNGFPEIPDLPPDDGKDIIYGLKVNSENNLFNMFNPYNDNYSSSDSDSDDDVTGEKKKKPKKQNKKPKNNNKKPKKNNKTTMASQQTYNSGTFDVTEQRIYTPPDDSLHQTPRENMQNLNKRYTNDPLIKYGVNGFGKRYSEDSYLLKNLSKQTMMYPKNNRDFILEDKVSQWNTDILNPKMQISSYDNGSWYKYE
jgi:hypothetical protein